jgi:hypothetical protein
LTYKHTPSYIFTFFTSFILRSPMTIGLTVRNKKKKNERFFCHSLLCYEMLLMDEGEEF